MKKSTAKVTSRAFHSVAFCALIASGALAKNMSAQAAVIAVVDSGVDYQHPELAEAIWRNSNEIEGNKIDDDANTYIDDIMGWNFAENNPQVIDYQYLKRPSETPLKFFAIQKKILEDTATPEEIAWVKENIANKDFQKELQVFGNFVHGTHVAGISYGYSAKQENGGALVGAMPSLTIMPIKLLPTEVKLPGSKKIAFLPQSALSQLSFQLGSKESLQGTTPGPKLGEFLRDLALKRLLAEIAKVQGGLFSTVGSYVNLKEAQVANLSLGTSTEAAKMIVTPLAKVLFGKETPTEEDILKYAKHLVSKMVLETSKMAQTSPRTLFVIAAGNDANNNDELPVAPANMREPNSISVAATFSGSKLATFSNYGPSMVDIAAPGVGIVSTIPGNRVMALSGTSQAAPFVAYVAGRVVDENKELMPAQVKEILMRTSDSKEFLQGMVACGGIVNEARAVMVASLMKEGTPMKEALSVALNQVADVVYDKAMAFESNNEVEPFALPLPSTLVP